MATSQDGPSAAQPAVQPSSGAGGRKKAKELAPRRKRPVHPSRRLPKVPWRPLILAVLVAA